MSGGAPEEAVTPPAALVWEGSMYGREPGVWNPASPGDFAAPSLDRLPAFARSSAAVRGAYLVAREAHARPGHGDTPLDHPVAVATLVGERGYGPAVVSAALLHDTVEDTPIDLPLIEERFGSEVAALVADLTEDPRIEQYPARKAEARARAVRDPAVAAIYAADKLAHARSLLSTGECIGAERLDHYVKTLWLFSEHLPELPFLSELSVALTYVIDRDADRVAIHPAAPGRAVPVAGRGGHRARSR